MELVPVALEEALSLHLPGAGSTLQGKSGAHSHPDRVEVRDRAASDDIAGEGRHVADLHTRKPVQLLAELS